MLNTVGIAVVEGKSTVADFDTVAESVDNVEILEESTVEKQWSIAG